MQDLEKLPLSWDMAAGENVHIKSFLVNLYRTHPGFRTYKSVQSFRQILGWHFKLLFLTSLAFFSTLF